MSALYPEWVTENEAAPSNTRAAAIRAYALHVDLAPRFGTKAWKREEDILYRGIRAFRCNICKRVVSADDGGADDMPDACSKCWCKANDGSYHESQRHIAVAENAVRTGDVATARSRWRLAAECQRAFVDGLRPEQVKTRAVYERSIAVLLERAAGVSP